MSQTQETISIKAGEKVELFSRSFSSVPMTYEFSASSLDGTKLQGQVETQSKNSFGKKSKSVVSLQQSNAIKATMWDTFLTIYVIAEKDLQVTVPKRQLGGLRKVFVLALLIVAVAAVLFIQSVQ